MGEEVYVEDLEALIDHRYAELAYQKFSRDIGIDGIPTPFPDFMGDLRDLPEPNHARIFRKSYLERKLEGADDQEAFEHAVHSLVMREQAERAASMIDHSGVLERGEAFLVSKAYGLVNYGNGNGNGLKEARLSVAMEKIRSDRSLMEYLKALWAEATYRSN